MLGLNLVSQNLKNEIKLRHIYEIIKRFILFLIIITIMIAIAILVAKIILQNNFNRIVEETTLITKNSQGQNVKIREINNDLNYISEIQNNYIAWSILYGNISGHIDNDIRFYLIKVDKDKARIDLQGIARSRDSLLRLEAFLEESEMLSNVEFPIRNILEKEDIRFEISANLNLKKIK